MPPAAVDYVYDPHVAVAMIVLLFAFVVALIAALTPPDNSRTRRR